MNRKRFFLISAGIFVVVILAIVGLSEAKELNGITRINTETLGNAITYQGYLTDGDAPADGNYDFYFELFDSELDGISVASTSLEHVLVEDGLFMVLLDFGGNTFNGEKRWLEISVRPGDSEGDYSKLTDRQEITPAPYAHYAIEAGEIDWTKVTNRPGGLDDGDNDTIYYSGIGLELDGATFNVLTDTIQTRISGKCVVGSYIQAINNDGSVECQADAPLNRILEPSGIISTTVDSSGDVGGSPSITIGSDGLPIISYCDNTSQDLKVAHCDDFACLTATNNTVDSTGDTGWNTSIVIGSDGLPIISYYDVAEGDLSVAHCDNVICSSAITSTLDSAGNTGRRGSIAIGSDGLPIISYYDDDNDLLKVAHCDNVTCTGATLNTINDVGNGGTSSIAQGIDGLPIMSYVDSLDLKIAHCDDLICSSTTITTLDTDGSIGVHSSITIGNDGLAITSYYDATNDALKVAHCHNITCSAFNLTTPDSNGDPGRWSTITIGSNGFPIISHNDTTNEHLKIAHCLNISCTNAYSFVLSPAGNARTAITIGVDGLPIVVYYSTENNLNAIHCTNPFCTPYWRRR